MASLLKVEVLKVFGNCPVYREGDYFFVREGFRLTPGNRSSFCMHGLSALMPYYVALARGIAPQDLGLSSSRGPGAYLQCLDPCSYTGGGTVVFCVTPLGEGQEVPRSRSYPERPFVGVGAVVLRGEEVLLIRRGAPPGRGLWSFPGGAVNAGESLAEAVRREVREECGVTIEVGPVIGVFDAIYHNSGGRPEYHYVLVDFLASYVAGEIAPASDVTAAAWVPVAEALDLELTPGARLLRARLREGRILGDVYYGPAGGGEGAAS